MKNIISVENFIRIRFLEKMNSQLYTALSETENSFEIWLLEGRSCTLKTSLIFSKNNKKEDNEFITQKKTKIQLPKSKFNLIFNTSDTILNNKFSLY